MRSRRAHAKAVPGLLVTVCAGVAIAGCGGSTSNGASQHAVVNVTRAAYVTSRLPGFKMAMTIGVAGLGQSATASGSGSFSLPGPRGQVTVSGPGTKLQEIIDWPDVYVHAAGHEVHGKPWVMVNAASAAQALGVGGSTGQNANPTEALQYLKASGTVTRVGSETVRGVQTTRYHVEADLHKYAALTGAQHGQSAQGVKLVERLTGQSTLPLEAWIDEQGRVRRVKMTLPICTPAGKISTAIDYELFDFGKQPPVNVPAASEVTDITEEAAAKVSQALKNVHC